MRTRVLAILAAGMAIQSLGCWRCCRGCGYRDPDRIPPAAVDRLPPPASPSAKPAGTNASDKQVGAYGGSGQ